MKRTLIALLGLTAVLLIITACTTSEAPTPTPFSTRSTATPNIGAASPLPVEFDDLVRNPIAYEGARIQLTGRYKKLPLLICDGEVFRSPATWTLVNDNLIAPLGGFDAQVKQMLPENITMVVNGVWRRWHGPIGCGKDAVTRDIWYLDVREIVSPNPLVLVTLTPFGEEVADAGENPTSTPVDDLPEEEVPIEEETAVAQPTQTVPTSTPRPTSTPDFDDEEEEEPTVTAVSPTPSATGENDEEDDDTSTATPSQTPNPNATATRTPQPGTNPTATSTPGDAPLITPTPASIDNGSITSIEIGFETVTAGAIHKWEISLSEDAIMTLSVVMQPNTNPVITLIDPLGDIVINAQDSSPANQPEIIDEFVADTSGVYEVLVYEKSGQSASYVLNFYEDTSSIINIFEGLFTGSTSGTDMLEEDSDDYWVFYAEENDVITFSVDPVDANADLFITLWGEDGDVAESDNDIGENEVIEDFVIPRTGIYSIQIADFDLLDRDYSYIFTIE